MFESIASRAIKHTLVFLESSVEDPKQSKRRSAQITKGSGEAADWSRSGLDAAKHHAALRRGKSELDPGHIRQERSLPERKCALATCDPALHGLAPFLPISQQDQY